jgi:outer membrane lipoprotein-sorting protein
MQPADDIRELFENAQLGIRPEPDEQVFEDMIQAQENAKKNPTGASERWRIVMKSPLSKLAVAAAIAVACVAGLFMWTGTQSSVALADVLTRIQQVSVYMYQMSMTSSGPVIGGKAFERELRVTALISRDLGMKLSTEALDPNSGESTLQEQYMLPHQKAMLTIMPSEKKYMRVEMDETLTERMRKQNNDPSSMVKQILDCDYTSLGRSTIDGIEVEGFRTTDPNYLSGMLGAVDIKIWVDVKTYLPVRAEMDVNLKMGEASNMHMRGVIHSFQWDVSVDAAEFEPVIPDDYTTIASGPLKMPPISEETAIKGLTLFAELSGRYPEKLDLATLISQAGKLAMARRPDTGQSREEYVEERTQELMDVMMPIQGIGTFYMLLDRQKKEPVYYGEIVTPDDVDQVLMRWKVSDDEYRVIFGSLHAETVTAETLAELEKTLPK